MYYDKKQNLISMAQCNELLEDKDYRVIGKAKLPDGSVVSTVWLGVDHSFCPGNPLIFETMVFDSNGQSQDCRRYHTEEEAKRGHQQAVAAWNILMM